MQDSPNINEITDGLENEDVGGFVTLEVIRDGKNGPEVIERRITHNLIVNTGKKQLWRIASGLSTNVFDRMRIGTGGTAANSGHTNVLTAVASSLTSVDSKTLLSATRTMQWVNSYPSGGGSISATNIQEVCLLNQQTSPGGSAMMRATFTSVNKTTADKLKITYNARIT